MPNQIRDDVVSVFRASIVGESTVEEARDEIIDNVVSVLVNQIEALKTSASMEYHNFKDVYLAGAYRRSGFTKREAEDLLLKRRSEVAAFEQALSVLYRAMQWDGE